MKLTPFANLAIPALRTLGDGGAERRTEDRRLRSGPRGPHTLGTKTGPASNNLAAILDTFDQDGRRPEPHGLHLLLDRRDQRLRQSRPLPARQPPDHRLPAVPADRLSGCEAFFQHTSAPSAATKKKKKKKASKTRSAKAKLRSASPLPHIDVPNLQDLLPQPAPDQGESTEPPSPSDGGSDDHDHHAR